MALLFFPFIGSSLASGVGGVDVSLFGSISARSGMFVFCCLNHKPPLAFNIRGGEFFSGGKLLELSSGRGDSMGVLRALTDVVIVVSILAEKFTK